MSRRTWLVCAAVAVVAAAILVGLVLWGYQWEGSGFGASKGPIKNPKAPFDYYPSKSLWDWMQLLVIPLALAIVGIVVNRADKRREQETARSNRATDLEIARNREQETVLAAYLEQMSALLLAKDRGLRISQPEDEVQDVARAHTLAALRRVEGSRKAAIVQFLREAGLIDKNKPIVVLRGADLRDADLREANLSWAHLRAANLEGANLHEADLRAADLREANLYGADLHDANLEGADLREADLREANLSWAYLRAANLRAANLTGVIGMTTEQLEEQAASLEGATMPDGKTHP